ncbi:MAG: hypothetical protein ACOH1K_03285 [Rhodoglobus sp.]
MTKTTTPEFARRMIAGLTLTLPLLVVIVSWLLWREELPGELASHWSSLAQADDVMPVGSLLALSLVITGAAAIAGIVIAVWPRMSRALRRGSLLTAGVFAGLGASTWLLSAGLTLAAGDPFESVLGGWVVLLVASAGYGIIAYLIAPNPADDYLDLAHPDAGETSPNGINTPHPMVLRPSEVGAWSRTITGTIFAWATLGLCVLGAVIYTGPILAGRGGEQSFSMIVMGLATIVVASFIQLRITADWRGLRVVSSVLNIPLRRIRLNRIAAIEAVDVLRPTEWGGWGYRIMPGRSALIMKKGPGLVVTTTRGTLFAITLPDPETPAALLTSLSEGARN